ncbi:unnamed protein product [Closterium sp. NIES-65]|nr:unnamed protein product [Closterium sp. NIES-65]
MMSVEPSTYHLSLSSLLLTNPCTLSVPPLQTSQLPCPQEGRAPMLAFTPSTTPMALSSPPPRQPSPAPPATPPSSCTLQMIPFSPYLTFPLHASPFPSAPLSHSTLQPNRPVPRGGSNARFYALHDADGSFLSSSSPAFPSAARPAYLPMPGKGGSNPEPHVPALHIPQQATDPGAQLRPSLRKVQRSEHRAGEDEKPNVPSCEVSGAG